MMDKNIYVSVVLPLPLKGTYSYELPHELETGVVPGIRVAVPFGKKLVAAIVWEIGVEVPPVVKPKSIAYLIDDKPIITTHQRALWEWVATYYMCGLGTVMNAALPASMKLSSQSTLSLSGIDADMGALSETARLIVNQLRTNEQLQISTLEKLDKKSRIQREIDALVKDGVVVLSEELKEQVKPKTESFIGFAQGYTSENAVQGLMTDLINAPKQLQGIMQFLQLSDWFGDRKKEVPKTALRRSGVSDHILRELLSKGILVKKEHPALRFEDPSEIAPLPLSDDQKVALEGIRTTWRNKNICLIHGTTGSGKTHLYIELIKEAIQRGKQSLFLVPEIGLSTQLTARIQSVFGNDLVVYHSRISQSERLTLWLRLQSENPPKVILGARSAIFLPLSELGLIIIDEEHDASYKQNELAPFYNARDCAIWLANKVSAKVLLGSATPSVESYFNTETGKYGLVKLQSRYGDIQMPEIQVIDLRKAQRDKAMHGVLSKRLKQEIEATLRDKKQVILFQNRRGYAPFMLCESCGWTAMCINCDVSLTYHQHFERLICHYCSYSTAIKSACPACESRKVSLKGSGTEKIEEELELMFEDARIARMDLDTTRKKMAFEQLISSFENGDIDIMVGTQMITKGLDFDNVGLVGVLAADGLWNRPDFRAFERAYQLLTQVAGRAGRKKQRGRVMIQAYTADHPVLEMVMAEKYDALYNQQLEERNTFDYPPKIRLMKFSVSHPKPDFTKNVAQVLAALLREKFGRRVLGPEEPPISRIRNRFYRTIFLKVERELSLNQVRNAIQACVDRVEGDKILRKARIQIDVDPQ